MRVQNTHAAPMQHPCSTHAAPEGSSTITVQPVLTPAAQEVPGNTSPDCTAAPWNIYAIPAAAGSMPTCSNQAHTWWLLMQAAGPSVAMHTACAQQMLCTAHALKRGCNVSYQLASKLGSEFECPTMQKLLQAAISQQPRCRSMYMCSSCF
jgi:hypothetical protein